jgi:hypothetical protein
VRRPGGDRRPERPGAGTIQRKLDDLLSERGPAFG